MVDCSRMLNLYGVPSAVLQFNLQLALPTPLSYQTIDINISSPPFGHGTPWGDPSRLMRYK